MDIVCEARLTRDTPKTQLCHVDPFLIGFPNSAAHAKDPQ